MTFLESVYINVQICFSASISFIFYNLFCLLTEFKYNVYWWSVLFDKMQSLQLPYWMGWVTNQFLTECWYVWYGFYLCIVHNGETKWYAILWIFDGIFKITLRDKNDFLFPYLNIEYLQQSWSIKFDRNELLWRKTFLSGNLVNALLPCKSFGFSSVKWLHTSVWGRDMVECSITSELIVT